MAENVFRAAWYEHRDLSQGMFTVCGGDSKDLEEVWYSASHGDTVLDTTKVTDAVER